MAGPTATLGFEGDESDAIRAIERTTKAVTDFDADVDRSSSSVRSSSERMGQGFDKAGDAADGTETRIMGLRDSVDGAAAVMAGPGEQGISAYLQGWADLASGIANFAVPAIKAVVATSLDQVKATATAVAGTATAVASQVAQWVVLGAQATAHAAKVAAAWLISIGPVVLIGAAVAGLVYLFIEHFDTIKRVVGTAAGWVRDRLSELVGFFGGIGGSIAGAVGGVAEAITAPYRLAFDAIKRLWNNTVGGFRFEIPSWIPGVGGKGFSIPEMHAGGVIPGAPGTEVPFIGLAGERVVARGSGGSGGNTYHLTVQALDPTSAADAVVAALDTWEARNGSRAA